MGSVYPKVRFVAQHRNEMSLLEIYYTAGPEFRSCGSALLGYSCRKPDTNPCYRVLYSILVTIYFCYPSN